MGDMVPNLSDIKTMADVIDYLLTQTHDSSRMLVWMALSIMLTMFYILFYTDTVEALAGTVNANAENVGELIPFT